MTTFLEENKAWAKTVPSTCRERLAARLEKWREMGNNDVTTLCLLLILALSLSHYSLHSNLSHFIPL